MVFSALLLLAAAAFADETMESLLKGLRSEDPAVRSRATADLLAAWSSWKDGDLALLDQASRDADPELSGRAAEAGSRIRIRRTLGQNLIDRIPKADEAFFKGDDAAKLAVLEEAKAVWKDGKLGKQDLAGLELLSTRAQWTDSTALDRFLNQPDARRTFSLPGDPEARARVMAKQVESLGAEGKKRSGQVAEYLGDGAPEVRRTALRVIGGFQAREQAPRVAALLRDRHAGVRGEALELLGTWEAKEYAADFAKLLEDPNASVRWKATGALGAWGQKDAGPAIAKLLKDPYAPSRAEAAAVLGSFGAREFAADLAPLLGDRQAMVRRSAAYALGRFGAVEFAAPLKALLKDGDAEVRVTAAQALGQIGPDAHADEVVGLLRDADSDVRVEAAWVLGFTATKDDVRRIAALLDDPDAESRHAALWALGLLKAREFRAAVAALLADPAPWVRAEAALTLGRIGGNEDAPRIAAKLRDPDRRVRVQAALALGELGSGDPGGVLAGLERDPDRLLGLSSTLSLARLGKGSPATLRQALREVATDDLAFACLGTVASDAASFVQNREAWELLSRPLKLRRSVESWADLSAALSDAGLTLEIQTDCSIGRLDRRASLSGRDALTWLLGHFSAPTMILEGRKVRLVDRRDSLIHWQKQLDGK